MTKTGQALDTIQQLIQYCLQADGSLRIGNTFVDTDYLGGGLHIALSLITEIQKTMKRLLIVPNWQSTKTESCRYMPVKGTTKDDCYEALWQIQELLGTRICEIGGEEE